MRKTMRVIQRSRNYKCLGFISMDRTEEVEPPMYKDSFMEKVNQMMRKQRKATEIQLFRTMILVEIQGGLAKEDSI